MTDKNDLNYQEGEHFVLLDRFKAPEIYADGVSQLLIGYPMVKITFHTVLESGVKEIRKACATLTMDAPSALDMAFDILDACKHSEEEMLSIAGTNVPERLKAFLDRIPVEKAPPLVAEKSKEKQKRESKKRNDLLK